MLAYALAYVKFQGNIKSNNLLVPILNFQFWYARKFPYIVGDDGEIVGEGDTGDHGVNGAYGRAL